MGRGLALLAAVGLVVVVPRTALAQAGIFVGPGVTIPAGDYGDYANLGWIVSAGVHATVGENGLGVFGEGFFGMNNHSDVDGDKTNLYGGFGGLTFRLGAADRPGIFLIGNAGLLVHSYKSTEYAEFEGSETQFAFGGGAGFIIPSGNKSFWITARFIMSPNDEGDTAYLPIQAGITIPLGSR
jgi:hypothetical protein